MKKKVIILVIVALVAIAIIGGVVVFNNANQNDVAEGNNSSATSYASVEEIKTLINNIYAKTNIELAALESREIETADEIPFYTGLKSNENVEKVVVSESMMSSIAYSLVVVNVSEGADVEAMKQEMLDNIDTRKWICVEAETVYVTNHNNTIFLVMASEELAKPQYDAFKELVGGEIGKELVRKAEEVTFE